MTVVAEISDNDGARWEERERWLVSGGKGDGLRGAALNLVAYREGLFRLSVDVTGEWTFEIDGTIDGEVRS